MQARRCDYHSFVVKHTTHLTSLALLVVLGCGGPSAPKSPTPTTEPEAANTARVALTPTTELVLLDVPAGQAVLGASDEFVAALSPFDRQARVGGDGPVDEAQFLAHVADQVLSWDEEPRSAIEAAAAELSGMLAELGIDIPLPATVELVLTTGDEEIPGAAYTRGTTVIITVGAMPISSGLLAHELFHVLTRNNPKLRDELYATIGYEPIPPLVLPDALAAIRGTNPDAPVVGHAIRVRHDGSETLATQVILTSRPFEGGTLFEYIDLGFFALEDDGSLTLADGEPVRIPFDEAEGFFEQIGQNTQYIIHPEEILAENFRLLVTGAEDIDSPEVIARLRDVLAAPR
jgi:hypothetical protein